MAELRRIPRAAQVTPPDSQDKHDTGRRKRPSLAREGARCSRDEVIPVTIFPLRRFPIDLGRKPLPVSARMRLLLEIIIVSALIYLGWNRPFRDWAAQGGAMATSKIHENGGGARIIIAAHPRARLLGQRKNLRFSYRDRSQTRFLSLRTTRPIRHL